MTPFFADLEAKKEKKMSSVKYNSNSAARNHNAFGTKIDNTGNVSKDIKKTNGMKCLKLIALGFSRSVGNRALPF